MSLCTNMISIISYDCVEKYDVLHYFCEINFRPVQVHTLRTEARTEIYGVRNWRVELIYLLEYFYTVLSLFYCCHLSNTHSC